MSDKEDNYSVAKWPFGKMLSTVRKKMAVFELHVINLAELYGMGHRL